MSQFSPFSTMAAVSMDTEQFQQFLQSMQAIVLQTKATATSIPREGKRTIMDKGYNRLQKFSHGEEAWVDWSFDFKTILGTQCYQLKMLLEAVESEKAVCTANDLYQKFPDHMKNVEQVGDIVRMNHELYEALVMLTEGDAKKMVKGIPAGDGLAAWVQLNINFNRKTLARTLRAHKEAMHPKQAAMSHLLSAITEWEEKWRRMSKDVVGELPKIFKVAAFLEICPMEVQDVIYQNIDEAGDDYEKISQKVKAWVSNKLASRSEAVPMDIGHVKTDFPFEWQCSLRGQDVDVGAVGQHVQCYLCGVFWHTSRDCGTPKEHGKGGHGEKGPNGGGKCDSVLGKAGFSRI